MLNNIWSENDLTNTKIHFSDYTYLKKIFDNYLFTIKSYYANGNFKVDRPNFIVTILVELGIQTSEDVGDLYNELSENSSYVANRYGMVNSSNSNSKPFDGVVIENGTEFFIYNDENFDVTNPKDYESPLTCLYTTLDGILLTHPSRIISDGSTNIYSLNIPMLGVSYYYWLKRQEFTGGEKDPARFVFEVVYLNLINSMLDIAMLNRFILYSKGDSPSPYIDFNPFMVKDYSRKLATLYRTVILKVHTHRSISDYLVNIPAFSKSNMFEVIQLPDLYYNRKNEWLGWLARGKYLLFIIDRIDFKLNKDKIDGLAVTLRYKRNGKFFILDDKETRNTLKEVTDKLYKEIR